MIDGQISNDKDLVYKILLMVKNDRWEFYKIKIPWVLTSKNEIYKTNSTYQLKLDLKKLLNKYNKEDIKVVQEINFDWNVDINE